MLTLSELKEWLRIDFSEDDNLLLSLLNASCATIEIATGVSKDYVESCLEDTLVELYKMTQILLITDIYNNENGENKALTSYYIQLESEYARCKNEN